MPGTGTTKLTENGSRSINSAGRTNLCGACFPFVLGRFTTNAGSQTRRCWNIPFHGPGWAPCGHFWRIIEIGTCYPRGWPWYGAGCVDCDGTLLWLPGRFCSEFSYDGFMELQIGCLFPESPDYIVWPSPP